MISITREFIMRHSHQINLTKAERDELVALISKRSVELRLFICASIILQANEGKKNREIASAVGCSKVTVIK
jgi:hypothetical protein